MVQLDEFGKYIYHFTSAETAILYILPTLRLKISSFSNTNDPRENKTFNFGQIFDKLTDDHRFEVKNSFKDYLNKYCNILCFSNDYKIESTWLNLGYNHPRMWAQYADKHRGVCLVINRKVFIKENEKSFFDDVNYTYKFQFPSIDQDEYLKANSKEDFYKDFLSKNYKDFFFSKHLDWQSEHESRLVCLDKSNYCSIASSLHGIYLGESFDKNLYIVLRKILPDHNIWIQKIGINEGRLFPLLTID
jgi:hypothetical protein